MSEVALYQQKAARWLNAKQRAILGSDAGTGKSLVVLWAFSALYTEGQRLLIVAPAFLLLNWKDEITKWFPHLANDIQILKTGKMALQRKTFTICSYEIAAKRSAEFRDLGVFTHLVCDECQALKNRTAKRTKALLGKDGLGRKLITWLLSGTPFPSHIADAYTLFSFCSGGKFGTYWEFAEKYAYIRDVVRGNKFAEQIAVGQKPEMLPELVKLVTPFLYRDKLSDVVSELPDFSINRIRLEHTPETKKLEEDNQEILEQIKDALMNGKTPEQTSSESRYRREFGTAKVAAAMPYILGLAEQGEPIVIFCWHREVANLIASTLRAAGHETELSTGMVSKEARHVSVARVQQGYANNLVATIASLGVGVNITRPSRAIFVEEGWTYEQRQQAMARLRRIGQKRFVNFDFLTIIGSIDEIVYEVVSNKTENIENFWNVFEGKEITTKVIKAEEINWDD